MNNSTVGAPSDTPTVNNNDNNSHNNNNKTMDLEAEAYRAICQISAGERYAAEWRKKLADVEQRIVAEQQRMMAALEELKAAEAAQDSQAARTSRPTPPDNGKTTDRAGVGA